MDRELIERKFEAIGARIRIEQAEWWKTRDETPIRIAIEQDRRGEIFVLSVRQPADPELHVVDLRPDLRHLLLLYRDVAGKHRYLCGHDERHWFVAAVPENAPGVATVPTAFRALQPEAVRERIARAGLNPDRSFRRRNPVYVRQGEWFFVPVPGFTPPPRLVRRREPITGNTRRKAHVLEFCYRVPGTGSRLLVSRRHPKPLTENQYRGFLQVNPEARGWGWRVVVRDPEVYGKGRVVHPDHATIVLHDWHRIYMNTEAEASPIATGHVAFYD